MKRPLNKKNVKQFNSLEPALYVVSTPIGNTLDWTLRAQHVLSCSDYVASEDTRVLKQLAHKAGIEIRKLITYHEHNEKQSSEGLIKLILAGSSVALVTDAGTPQISDPGYRVIKLAYEKNVKVIPIPGVSSLTTALSISPLGGGNIFFGGFLPVQQKARKSKLEESKHKAHQIVFFEAPHRLRECLQDISEVFGAKTEILVCRELTKPYEEVLLSNVEQCQNYFNSHEPRGEFVLIIKAEEEKLLNEAQTKIKIHDLLSNGRSAQDILESLQPVSEISRKEIYRLIQTVKKSFEKV